MFQNIFLYHLIQKKGNHWQRPHSHQVSNSQFVITSARLFNLYYHFVIPCWIGSMGSKLKALKKFGVKLHHRLHPQVPVWILRPGCNTLTSSGKVTSIHYTMIWYIYTSTTIHSIVFYQQSIQRIKLTIELIHWCWRTFCRSAR